MNRHERLTAVLQLLAERRSLSIDDAVVRLGVSPATARRDFDHLAEQQLLTRTRGGAIASTVSYDLPLRYKVGQRADQKERIARAVVDLLAPGSVVGLNGGTTLTEVAHALTLSETFRADERGQAPNGAAITVVTNALNIANELVLWPHIKVVVVGGVARHRSYELVGPLAARVLDTVTLDIAVIGANAVHPVYGAMAADEGEAAINALLAERAARVVVAADSSKVARRSFAEIIPVGSIDVLVTDTGAGSDAVAQFVEQGVEVFQA